MFKIKIDLISKLLSTLNARLSVPIENNLDLKSFDTIKANEGFWSYYE